MTSSSSEVAGVGVLMESFMLQNSLCGMSSSLAGPKETDGLFAQRTHHLVLTSLSNGIHVHMSNSTETD